MVGKSALVEGLSEPTTFSNQFVRIRLKEDTAAASYVARFLQREHQRGTFSHICKRWVNQAAVATDDLLAVQIPLPPLAEQKRIAAILDQAGALRRLRRRALDRLNILGQAIFQEMFGAIGQPSTTLGAFVEDFRYGTSNKASDDGFPTLRIPNVVGGQIDVSDLKRVSVTPVELQRLKLKGGDLLFVRTNGNPDYVGRCAAFDETLYAGDWIYASYLIRARLGNLICPEFATTYLQTPDARKALRERSKTSAGQYNINIEGLSVCFGVQLVPT